MKKFFIGLLSLVCTLTGGIALAACGISNGNGGEVNNSTEASSVETQTPTEIEQVYAQYVAHAKEKNENPLSYEAWLASIKGETGAQGPQGEKGETGEQGPQGEKGETGKQGPQGEQGVGIKSVTVNDKGQLVITLTDGTTLPAIDMPSTGNGDSTSETNGTEGLRYQRMAGKDEYRLNGLGLAAELDIVIPSTYNGLPVTEISASVFREYAHITSVTIGDNVTTIGENAFYKCENLTSVTIGDSVTSIGAWAFSGCESLTSVYYTGDIAGWCNISFGSWVSNPLSYAKNLYINNELVTELVIPETVTEIKDYAFYSCNSLTSVTIGDNVNTIGGNVFYKCENLTSVIISDKVTSIGELAFYDCNNLTSITFEGTVAEWNAIAKDYDWNYNVPVTEVVCSDGKAMP